MSFMSSSYLKDYFKAWSDDDLYDRHRELSYFYDENNFEKHMIELESERRKVEFEKRV